MQLLKSTNNPMMSINSGGNPIPIAHVGIGGSKAQVWQRVVFSIP